MNPLFNGREYKKDMILLSAPLFGWDKDRKSFDIEKLMYEENFQSLESIGNTGDNARELLQGVKEILHTLSFLDIPSMLITTMSCLRWNPLMPPLDPPNKPIRKFYFEQSTILSIVKGSLLYIHSRLKEKFLANEDKEIIVLEAMFFFLFHAHSHFIIRGPMSGRIMVEQFSKFAGLDTSSWHRGMHAKAYALTNPPTLKNFINELNIIHEQQDVEHLAMIIRVSPSHALGRMSFDLTRYIALFLHNVPGHSLYHPEFRL
jgi:hypothetical protein